MKFREELESKRIKELGLRPWVFWNILDKKNYILDCIWEEKKITS